MSDPASMDRNSFGLEGEILERMAPRRHGASAVPGADRELLLGLVERHLKLIPTGRPDEADSVLEIDTAQYRDAEVFAREKRAIFDRCPVIAGFSQDIPRPGDFLKVDDLDTPIFVTRARDGTPRAFVNSCRHRGAALVHEMRGSGQTVFTCPYHGWSYRDDGRLLGIPSQACFEGVNKGALGLIEVPCEELAGLIFIAPRPDVALDLEAHLGPELVRELACWGFEKVGAARSEPIELAANWKLVYDTFLESYHFAVAHRKNLAAYFVSNVQTIDCFGKHMRISTAYKTLLDEWPRKAPAERVPENYIMVKYALFPGMIIITSAQVVEVFRIFPKGVERTTVQHACYSRLPLEVEGNARLFEMIWQSAHNIVQNEDFPFGALAPQRSLRSGAVARFVIGRNELPIQINYRSIAESLAS
jgi:phenylpropionate dioxygenase-like ring-hydroxylating dioxygenase large terminal subunit